MPPTRSRKLSVPRRKRVRFVDRRDGGLPNSLISKAGWVAERLKAGIELGGGELAGATRHVFAEVLARHFGMPLAPCLRFAGLISDEAVERASRRAVVLAIGPDYRVFEAPSLDRLPSVAADAVFVVNLSAHVAEARRRLAARGTADG